MRHKRFELVLVHGADGGFVGDLCHGVRDVYDRLSARPSAVPR